MPEGKPSGAWTIALAVLAFLTFGLNFVSGFLYTSLKFDVLGHTDGTGVIPGPWLIVPLLAVLVIPAGAVVGVLFFVIWRSMGRTGGFVASMSTGFLVASVVFHALVIVTIVADPDYYAFLADPGTASERSGGRQFRS